MSIKLKSFEQFVNEMDRAEEIEQEIVDMGTPEDMTPEEAEEEAEEVQGHGELEESVNESCGTCGEEPCVCESEEVSEGEESEEEEVEESEEEVSEEEVSEAEEVEEDRAEDIEAEMKEMGTPKSLAEALTEMYESACVKEAKAYEEDAHDEHTVESYMKENAALVAALAAGALKEMKDDYAVEAYEAACNEMAEAYSKKMNEMKEMDSAMGSDEESAE